MKLGKNFKKRGFTLIEAVIALSILSMVVLLGSLSIETANGEMKRDYENKLETIVQDLESPKHGFKLVGLESDQLKLYSMVEEKTYYLGLYRNMLRYTPGHMPLMLEIAHVRFSKEGNLIKIEITVRNQKFDALVFIPQKEK
ncbi:competence type IV pilus minor pilin ComGF [Pediococcus stilesii]|nr:competence type IV pilus minor pilin ComGF [Pediococcus stilesii]